MCVRRQTRRPQCQLRTTTRNGQRLSSADPEAVSYALQALLSTKSWDETRAVLDREQPLLLTQTAQLSLLALIAKAREETNAEAADYFERHLRLLRRAREVGIATAWAEFETALPTGGRPAYVAGRGKQRAAGATTPDHPRAG